MAAIPDRRSPCRIDQAKGARRHHCSAEHADLVESFRLAQYAQDARCEQAAIGYATEEAAYYARDGGTERRVTFKDWLIHTRRRRDDEDEEEMSA